jgi:hypothetical protein
VCEGEEEDGGEGEKLASPFVSFHGVETCKSAGNQLVFENRAAIFAGLTTARDLVRFLVDDHGADVHARKNDGWNVLHQAVYGV